MIPFVPRGRMVWKSCREEATSKWGFATSIGVCNWQRQVGKSLQVEVTAYAKWGVKVREKNSKGKAASGKLQLRSWRHWQDTQEPGHNSELMGR